MGKLIKGNSSANSLSETSLKGDTLQGFGGNDTYNCRVSIYWKPPTLPGGDDGVDIPYATTIVEAANQGYDTARFTLARPVNGLTIGASQVLNVERIYLINGLSTTNIEFRLLLESGAQLAYGSTARDSISGGAGNDTLWGMANADSLNGGAGSDLLRGGKGNDAYYVTDAADQIVEQAGEGVDTVYASATHTLAANVEQLVLQAGTVNGAGNSGNNRIYAGTGNNVISGGGGTDTLSFTLGVTAGVTANLSTGGASGGSGTDSFSGFRHLEGSNFPDMLIGSGASNRLYGLFGNDTLDGLGGADSLYGGPGNDGYWVDAASDQVTELANEGSADFVVSSAGSFSLPDYVEQLYLDGAGNIAGTGNTGSNYMVGNSGNNVLSGGASLDVLEGGSGNDTLIGGTGQDELTGQAGADVFRYESAADGVFDIALRDRITDFTSGMDLIDLSAIDADASTPGDQAFVSEQISYSTGVSLSGAYWILDIDILNSSTDMQIEVYGPSYSAYPDIVLSDVVL